MFFRKTPKSRDSPWDSSPKQAQEFWLSLSRPMGHKSLEVLGLGQKSSGQSRDLELWNSSPLGKILGTGTPIPGANLCLLTDSSLSKNFDFSFSHFRLILVVIILEIKYLNEIFVCYHAYECTVVRAFFTYVNFEPFRF